jgi:ABC-2 type transport system ATP-binding protein
MEILTTAALSRRFNGHTAVEALTIAVEAKEVFGLLGPNGAGKTTTIKMLTTLLPPTSGTASVAGFDIVRQARDVRRVIGYVPQLVSADGNLTGYENLLIFAKLYDLSRAERNSRIREALALMGLTEAADRMVREYSGGMIRRLEIAQSMLHRPQVLFLDEPTVGLDPVARRAVWEHIERLRKEYGTTILVTTHLMEEADNLCHRVAIMHQGRVVALDTPETLKGALGLEGTTLDDVFVHYAGGTVDPKGGYSEVSRTRRTAQRLG